ncbi:MAG: HAMP domain-containing sensor histidine kinase [Hyphomicrobiales bacterium]
MVTDETQTLLDDLDSRDWVTVQDAVDMAGDLLRHRNIDPNFTEDVATRFVRLAAHPKWEVRKSVAHALLFLRHEQFHAALAKIIEDENAWVREAARKTLQRRTELTRADINSDDHGDKILGLLKDLESRHGSQARRAALKIADNLHTRFVRLAYHEIVRIISPLDASLMNLERELQEIPGVPTRSRSHIERARGRVRLLADILDNLREFTSEPVGNYTSENLLPLIKEAEELALSNIDHPAAGLVVHSDVDTALRVEANRSRLLQAVINVIVNAIEACQGLDRKAEINIAARMQAESHIAISISDNGCGMGEEAVRDCVQLYTTGKRNGMGFGLPLAKRIVEIDHQGTLSIDSAEGEGTTVVVVLPVEQMRVED